MRIADFRLRNDEKIRSQKSENSKGLKNYGRGAESAPFVMIGDWW